MSFNIKLNKDLNDLAYRESVDIENTWRTLMCTVLVKKKRKKEGRSVGGATQHAMTAWEFSFVEQYDLLYDVYNSMMFLLIITLLSNISNISHYDMIVQ